MNIIKNKVLIATGGTGGHIFPSISLADFLNTKYEVEMITDKRGLKYLKNYKKNSIKIINSGTIFERNFFKIMFGIYKVFTSLTLSIFFMIRSRPKLIIGMGGYSSFPVCLAGYFLRIPVLIYENNLVIGRANRFLLPIVKRILVSTNNIQGIEPKYAKKIFFCGYLIRDHILSLKKEKTINSEKKFFSLLVIGGSQSARVFGEILPEIIVKCFKKSVKFKIYQQCLDYQIDKIKKIYQKFNLEHELFIFSDDISKYYKFADLAISRSGASSIAELINLKIPFIAIPLPSSIDNHQLINAKYFKNKGYCFLLEEKFVSDKLFEILMTIKENENKLLSIKEKMSEHSDQETPSKIEGLIERILNE